MVKELVELFADRDELVLVVESNEYQVELTEREHIAVDNLAELNDKMRIFFFFRIMHDSYFHYRQAMVDLHHIVEQH